MGGAGVRVRVAVRLPPFGPVSQLLTTGHLTKVLCPNSGLVRAHPSPSSPPHFSEASQRNRGKPRDLELETLSLKTVQQTCMVHDVL